MKNCSIRTKITLWFSCVLVVIMALTYFVVLSVSNSVIQKTIRDSLIETVEDNVDEVEFFANPEDAEQDRDKDLYLRYEEGLLEIDDDFLDLVNGVYTALCRQDGMLLYGEIPVAQYVSGMDFSDGALRTVSVGGVTYYLYDRMLERDGLEELWLRGVVSERQGAAQLSTVVRFSLVFLPLLVLVSILSGYWIAGRSLRPVRQIEQAAKAINQGQDLKKRIDLGPGKDELHQLADTFDDMFDRLDHAFAAERQFTSDASHELRTPTSILPLIDESYEQILLSIQEDYKICNSSAKKLYHHLWIYTHGIASLCATKMCRFTDEEISTMITEVCMSILKKIKEEENKQEESE